MSIPYDAGEPLTCQEIRELDILAIEHVGIPGIVLMENASRAVAEVAFAALLNPARARVVFLCGPGNNGGDGFAAARHLRNAGVDVTVVLAADAAKSQGDAATNLAIYQRMEGRLLRATDPQELSQARRAIQQADLIVDALLGTGSRGDPRGTFAELIEAANQAPCARRLAIDIPSGLSADTGELGKPTFRADATVTFVAAKVGFAKAPEVVGRVVVADIGVPRELIPGRKEGLQRP